MICISKTFEFCASHRLARPEWSNEKNSAIFGKCANPNGHGHNYRLEVTVSGPIQPEAQMVMDASVLDAIVQERVIQELDHKHLNADVPWLQGHIPTVEVILECIWNELEEPVRLAGHGAQLEKLVLHETSRIFATRTRESS
jgi:6-pyruvoyltetrahydropterin/6-carboxytetrahydropterin synthase